LLDILENISDNDYIEVQQRESIVLAKAVKEGILVKREGQILNLSTGGDRHELWMTTDMIDNRLVYLGVSSETLNKVQMGAGRLSDGTIHSSKRFAAQMALSDKWKSVPTELGEYILACCDGIAEIEKRSQQYKKSAVKHAAQMEETKKLIANLYKICQGISIMPCEEGILFSHATKKIYEKVATSDAVATAHKYARQLAPLPSGKPKPKKKVGG
jgi:hypothetical protein